MDAQAMEAGLKTRDESKDGAPNESKKAPPLERQLSVSELASELSSGRLTSPWWLSWFEWPFKVKAPSTGAYLPEATGWAMDVAARAPINQAGAFLGAAILLLATVDAECANPATCTNTVYGFKPSSLLTLTSSLVSVFAAITMPIVGAIVDHTRFRKHVGIVTAAFFLVITGIQISISASNWFVMLVLEGIGGYMLIAHATTVFAYLPDLSRVESDLAHYTSRFNVRQFACQSLYVAILIIITSVRGTSKTTVSSSVNTAKEALGIALGMAAPLIIYAWTFLFRKRDPLREVPEGANLVTVGFIQVAKISRLIWTRYRALKWFMISLLWSPEAGAGAILSITTTFLIGYMRMTSTELAYVSLLTFAMCIPGSLFAKWLCNKVNPLISYRLGLLFWIFTNITAVLILTGPERKNWVYLTAVLTGLMWGWVYPSQRVLYATLTPEGQEMEMMGLVTFSGQLLGWLMPVLFTMMNERGVDMRWGLSLTSFFVAVSSLCLTQAGSYKDALAQVAKTPNETTEGHTHTIDSSSNDMAAPQEIDATNEDPEDKGHGHLQ